MGLKEYLIRYKKYRKEYPTAGTIGSLYILAENQKTAKDKVRKQQHLGKDEILEFREVRETKK